MRINLPKDVQSILDKLKDHGFLAYVVGGCVRDSLLMKNPGDWDITTSARPEDIKRLFKRTVDTGIKHGTVTVLFHSRACEVTTFRSDGEYLDHRHPEEVCFSDSLEEDLKRRDFTINAMAYNDEEGLIDLFHGRDDLEKGLIRAVGDPGKRFEEDALRMLRAVRFAAQLDFYIEKGTAAAIISHATDLKYISKERVYSEIVKLICSAHIEILEDAFILGLAPYIADHFDEIDIDQVRALCSKTLEVNIVSESTVDDSGRDEAVHSGGNPVGNLGGNAVGNLGVNAGGNSVGNAGGNSVGNADENSGLNAGRISAANSIKKENNHFTGDPDTYYNHKQGSGYELGKESRPEHAYIRFAFVTEGMDPEHVRAMLRSLKADNDTIDKVSTLARLILQPFPVDKYRFKTLMSGVEEKLFLDATLIKILSYHTELYRRRCRDEFLYQAIATYGEVIKDNEPVYMKDLAITGKDLIKAGIKEGPEIGEYLRKLLDFVHRWPEANEKDKLLKIVKNWQEEI